MPSKLVFRAGVCLYWLSRVAVSLAVLIAMRTARPARTLGGPPPSSNMVIDPSGWTIASCWNAVLVPAPILKLLLLLPSVHMIAPVWRLIL